MVVAGLAGFGKTMLVAHLLGQLSPSPAVQFVIIDGKGGPDYDRLTPGPGWRPRTTSTRSAMCSGKSIASWSTAR
jgi:hypothetical protein